MNSRIPARTVETWDLGELLAVLRQIAQDAGDTAGAARAADGGRSADGVPAHDEGERRA